MKRLSWLLILMLVACGPAAVVTPTISNISTPATAPTWTNSPRFTEIPTTNITEPTTIPRQMTQLAKIPDDCVLWEISPDAKWLTMECGIPADRALEILKIGDSPRALLEHGSYKVAFSPDSKKIAVAVNSQNDESDTWKIWIYNIDEWQNPELLLSFSSVWGPYLNWAPDSQSIAVSYLEDEYALSILYLDGTYKNLLTYNDIQKDVAYGPDRFGPTWSPDGKKIAYVYMDFMETQPIQLWTVDVVSGKKELLYAGKPDETGAYPNWSPDGEKIAFVSYYKYNSFRLFVYNIKGKSVSLYDGFGFGTWSLDSRYLATLGDQVLNIIDLETNQITEICQTCSRPINWIDNDKIIARKKNVLCLIPLP